MPPASCSRCWRAVAQYTRFVSFMANFWIQSPASQLLAEFDTMKQIWLAPSSTTSRSRTALRPSMTSAIVCILQQPWCVDCNRVLVQSGLAAGGVGVKGGETDTKRVHQATTQDAGSNTVLLMPRICVRELEVNCRRGILANLTRRSWPGLVQH